MDLDKLRRSKMFLKGVRYYIYYPEELELTVRVVNEAFRQAKEYLNDVENFDYESPACRNYSYL